MMKKLSLLFSYSVVYFGKRMVEWSENISWTRNDRNGGWFTMVEWKIASRSNASHSTPLKLMVDEIATDLLVQYFDFYETLIWC